MEENLDLLFCFDIHSYEMKFILTYKLYSIAKFN